MENEPIRKTEKKKPLYIWVAIVLIVLLLKEWESTKKAVVDAWKGTFHPSTAQVEK
jgi:hypothetical protein